MTNEVTTTDGLRLRVYESGSPDAPTVVCVHGYPDDHALWTEVAAELAQRYHVVSYDVRGAGHSGVPRDLSGYRLDQLVEDLVTVLDAVSPRRPVHLLAHDWGAVQAWHALAGERLRGRVASYTSISGPCLDHVGHWLRARLRRPTPQALGQLITQLAASTYVGFFQLPVLPELVWRSGLGQRVLARWEPTRTPAVSNAINGLQLYRANIPPRLALTASPSSSATSTQRSPATDLPTGPMIEDVPVQVLAPCRDQFISVAMQTEISQWVPNLAVRTLPGGHWLPRTHPQTVARCVSELIEHTEGGPEARALRRARVNMRPRQRFQDHLLVVTGAGSGIGRSCALEFAAHGAEVIVTDIDEQAARSTADSLGPGAHAYPLDVTDGAAMARFATMLRETHGIPDIVINNAGIGMAGPFFDTTVDEWERVIDVNLWGVIHGCRALGGLMVAGGTGGTIVNIASAAAYLPTKALPAYATTKAAVLALSQCLRAELAPAGIGVVAVCPGFVHTNIASTTRFVGLDAVAERAARHEAIRRYRRRNFTAQQAAREIRHAVERNAAIAPITIEAKAGLLASRLTPALVRALARVELNSRATRR